MNRAEFFRRTLGALAAPFLGAKMLEEAGAVDGDDVTWSGPTDPEVSKVYITNGESVTYTFSTVQWPEMEIEETDGRGWTNLGSAHGGNITIVNT